MRILKIIFMIGCSVLSCSCSVPFLHEDFQIDESKYLSEKNVFQGQEIKVHVVLDNGFRVANLDESKTGKEIRKLLSSVESHLLGADIRELKVLINPKKMRRDFAIIVG